MTLNDLTDKERQLIEELRQQRAGEPMTAQELADELFILVDEFVADGGQVAQLLALLIGKILAGVNPRYRRRAWNHLRKRTFAVVKAEGK